MSSSKGRNIVSLNPWTENFKILVNSVKDYARQWKTREKEELDILFDWVQSMNPTIQIRIKNMNGSMSTRNEPTFKDIQILLSTCLTSMINMLFSLPTNPLYLSHLHDKYVVLPANKPPTPVSPPW